MTVSSVARVMRAAKYLESANEMSPEVGAENEGNRNTGKMDWKMDEGKQQK